MSFFSCTFDPEVEGIFSSLDPNRNIVLSVEPKNPFRIKGLLQLLAKLTLFPLLLKSIANNRAYTGGKLYQCKIKKNHKTGENDQKFTISLFFAPDMYGNTIFY